MVRLQVTRLVTTVVIITALLAGFAAAPARGADESALTFTDISKLRIKRTSHDQIVDAARQRGVGFAVDDATAKRLKRMKFTDEQIDLLKRIHDDPEGFDKPDEKDAEEKPEMDDGGDDIFGVRPDVPFGPRKPKTWHAEQGAMAQQIAKTADASFVSVKNKDFTLWGSKATLQAHVEDLRKLETLAGQTWQGVYKRGLNPDSAHLVLCDTRYIYEQYVGAMFDVFAKNGITFTGQNPKEMALKSGGFSTSTAAVVDLTRFKPPDASRRAVAHNAGKMYMNQLTESRATDALVSGFGNVCETRMYGHPTIMTQSYDLRKLQQGKDAWSKMVAKLIADQQIADPKTIIGRYSMDSMQPPNYAEAWSLTQTLAGGTKQFETITRLIRDGTDPMKAIEDTYKMDNQTLFKKWVQSVR